VSENPSDEFIVAGLVLKDDGSGRVAELMGSDFDAKLLV
jgi:hypothetical protein